MVEFLLVFLALIVFVVAGVRSKTFRSKIRMIEGVWGFIRLWPNPGFKVMGRHWCRHYGRKVH